jgi:alkyldihydroxyacetonephosphate synthase
VSLRVDRVSLLVDVHADETVASAEATLAGQGLTLGLEFTPPMTVGQWLAEGASGARDAWSDPADHLVAGLEVELLDGQTLVVRPAPRRATGPDLVALVLGARDRFATLRRVWLRVHVVGERRATTAPFEGLRDPPMTAAEEGLLASIARELGRPR